MIRKVLAGIKRHRLFVYLFVAVAVLGVAVTTTMTSEVPNSEMAITSVTPTVDGSVAIDYYNRTLENEMVDTSSAAAAEGGYESLSELTNALNSTSGSVQGLGYFAFARWSTVTLIPVPAIGFANIGSLVVAAFVSLANLMFTIGGVVLLAVGLLMLLITSLNILSSFMPTIDWFFSNLTLQFLFNTTGGTANSPFNGVAPLFIAIGIFIVALAVRLSPLARKDGSLLGDMIISAIAIAVLMGMSTNSSQNWNNSNNYAVDQLNGGTSQIPFGKNQPAGVNVDTGNPESYAPWSFGRVLTIASDGINTVVNFASNFVSGVTSGINNAVSGGSTIGSSGSDCSAYLEGMHVIGKDLLGKNSFVNIADTNVQSIMAFDDLVYTILYQPAAEASYGSNQSGDATWCRMWEAARGSDPVEQAYIARTASMYGYALNNGVYLDSNGNYKSGYDKRALAGFFGNSIATEKGTAAFKFYWAACQFMGNDVNVSPAFAGAIGAEVDDKPTPSGKKSQQSVALNQGACIDPIIAKDNSGGFSFGTKNNDARQTGQSQGGCGANNSDCGGLDMLSPLAYVTTAKTPLSIIGFSVPADVSSMLGATPEAYNFFKMVYGSTSGLIWPAAVVAVVGTIMMTIGILPMQLGALVLQMISVLSLMAFPIVLLVLILPIGAGRKAFMTVVKLFVSSKMIQFVFVAFIAIAIAIINMLNMAFDSVLNSSIGGVGALTGDGTPLGTFMTAILHAVAIGLAFFGTKKLMTMVFKSDVTTIKGAMSVGQQMSSQAVNGASFKEMGFGQLKGLGKQSSYGNVGLPEMGSGQNEDSQPQQPAPRDAPNPEKEESPTVVPPVTDAPDNKDAPNAGDGEKAPIILPVPTVPEDQAVPPNNSDAAPFRELESGPSEAPVPNDEVNLTSEERQAADEGTEAIRNTTGAEASDVDEIIAARDTSNIEESLGEALDQNNPEAAAQHADSLGEGATALLPGVASTPEEAEPARREYFDNEVDNSDEPTDREPYRAGQMDVKGVTLERNNGDSEGVGRSDNNAARAENNVPSPGAEYAAPGMAEDVSTSSYVPTPNVAEVPATNTEDNSFGAEGLSRRDEPSSRVSSGGNNDSLPSSDAFSRRLDSIPSEVGGAVGSVMEGAFERFDALGRTIQESAELQSRVIRDASEEQVRATAQQTQSLENLQQTIAAWFPNRGGTPRQ